MSGQIARRGKGRAQAAAPLSVEALRAIVGSKGEAWVLQQVASGVVKLSSAAARWWTASVSGAPSTAMVATALPATLGVAVRGNAKMNGSVRIRHRELMATFTAGVTSSWRVNPVDAGTFPYLSTLARMYDRYKIHSLSFVTVAGTPSTAAGRWYAAWDPDSSDSSPVSYGSYMAMEHSVSHSAWQSGSISIAPMSQFRLVEEFPDDLKDHGRFWWTNNATTGSFDIYVEYDITLDSPNIESPTHVGKGSYDTLLASGAYSFTYGPRLAQPMLVPTAKTFRLAPGFYLIHSHLRGTGLTAGAWTVSDLGGGSSVVGAQRSTTTSTTEVARAVAVSVSSFGAIVVIGDTGTFTTNRCLLSVSPVSAQAYTDVVDSFA